MDLALTPVGDEDMDKLAMFHETAGGEAGGRQAPRRGPRPRQGRCSPSAGGGALTRSPLPSWGGVSV